MGPFIDWVLVQELFMLARTNVSWEGVIYVAHIWYSAATNLVGICTNAAQYGSIYAYVVNIYIYM